MIHGNLIDPKELGIRIRHIRKRNLDMTQAELAEALHLSRPMTVSDWERGSYPPSRERLQDFAQLAGVSVSEIIGEVAATEETPEQAAAAVLPDVSYLQPAARAFYERTVGSWVARRWPMASIQYCAKMLVAPVKNYNVMKKAGAKVELNDDEQLQFLEGFAQDIEEIFGPDGIMKDR